MPITFSCPCGKQLKVGDQFAGKRAKCPVCTTVVNVPEAAPVSDYEFVEEEEPVPALPSTRPAPPPPKRVAAVSEAPKKKLSREEREEEEERENRRQAKKDKARAKRKRERAEEREERSGGGGGGGSAAATAIGGLILMVVAGVLFVLGLMNDRIHFGTIILFVCGVISLGKGMMGHSEE